jgi:hypothetical protein
MWGLGASGAAMVRLEQPLALPWRRSSIGRVIWPLNGYEGFWGRLQTTPTASATHGYGLEVLGPHVRRQEVDKRCLENNFLQWEMAYSIKA